MKRIFAALLIVAAVALAGVFYLRHGYVYEISQADIQSRIEPQFPVEKCVLVFCIELDKPFVKLRDGRARIEFGSEALMEVAFSKDQYDGNAGFSGELRYISEDSAFFLQDSKLEFLEVNGVSEERKKDLDQLAALLVSEYLRANPIYSFRGTALELFAPWLELKEVNVRDEILSVRVGLVD